MAEPLLCSECFRDQGLRLDAFNIGTADDAICRQCGRPSGRKLDADLVEHLAHRFFVRGSFHRTTYGGAPEVQFNDSHYGESTISVSEWLKRDVELIGEAVRIGFFHYGPRLWMVGEVEPLTDLQDSGQQATVIQRVLQEYPERQMTTDERFFRLRKNPKEPPDEREYDSPPAGIADGGRLGGEGIQVLYGSQDLQICIHECRVTVEDELYVATLRPERPLRLLDLTALIPEDTTEFESIDMAVHMLFLAAEHSYEICRAIALAARSSGFDGLIYPSYFSLVRTGAIPFDTVYGLSVRRFPSFQEQARSQVIGNVAVFGRPVENKVVRVDCLNRLCLGRVDYDVHFGPVQY